jgi:NADH-quinone oxidoreductase subunit N
MTAAQIGYQLPLIILVAGGCLLLVLEAFTRDSGSRRYLMHLCALTAAIAAFAAWMVWRHVDAQGPQVLFSGMVIVDKFSLFLTVTFCVSAFVAALLSADYLSAFGVLYGEFYSLVLLTTAGMVILAMAADLVTVFLGVETMSIGAYVLTGSFRRAKPSAEAAMKYFITGAFATGILLYGIALVYGMAGTTNLEGIRHAERAFHEPVFLLGIFLLIVAFSFKIAVFPFHMWAPDVYEGAPTPVTGFMAAGVKAAGVAGFLRVFLVGFGESSLSRGKVGWTSVVFWLSLLTMTYGNLAALREENVKRMLAYSSIAHAGYILVGVAAAGSADNPAAAQSAILYYLIAYTFTTLGSFGVVAWLGYRREMIDDWAGLAARNPAVAFAMTVFMLSLGGLPPTAGFFGKFYVFRAAIEVGEIFVWLVIAAVLNSVLSMYYYLRVVMAMYFREPVREPRPLQTPAVHVALAICVLAVLFLGLLPAPVVNLSNAAAVFAPGKP